MIPRILPATAMLRRLGAGARSSEFAASLPSTIATMPPTNDVIRYSHGMRNVTTETMPRISDVSARPLARPISMGTGANPCGRT